MYVRDAKNRDEVWLLKHIEAMELDETAFRSRDYVIAMDEQTGDRAGFGRIRVHKTGDNVEVCELTSIGVLKSWRGQGVGAHVVERLVTTARDKGFSLGYALTSEPDYLAQFGFGRVSPAKLSTVLQDRLREKQGTVDPGAVPQRIDTTRFRMPSRLREAFKSARVDDDPEEPPENPEDFGIDPNDATYKYDTG